MKQTSQRKSKIADSIERVASNAIQNCEIELDTDQTIPVEIEVVKKELDGIGFPANIVLIEYDGDIENEYAIISSFSDQHQIVSLIKNRTVDRICLIDELDGSVSKIVK